MNNGISFWRLLNEGIDGNKIPLFVVPVIQRDYAQGRTDEKAGTIRQKFLDSIGDALNNGESLSLDFIYGAQTDTHVELIDGQQRFTTLFLVHWYLAGRTNQEDPIFSVLKKFTYRSRTASRDFCAKLCDNHNGIFKQIENALAYESNTQKRTDNIVTTIVQDATWFLRNWEKDPTVSSMLHMLDAIVAHEQLNADVSGAWHKLTSEQSPITFQFLSINKFGNSEDLYIKMNSRGKPLTSFENFKALFGKHLEELGEKQLYETFWANIDGDWNQTFWEFIKRRYRAKNIPLDRYFFQIDDVLLKYIWLQVEMYSVAFNSSRKEQPDFYLNDRPILRFEHIDDPKNRHQDWSDAVFHGKRPEALIVESLKKSSDILRLIDELLDEENGLTCWTTTSCLDRLFPMQQWDTDTKKAVVVKGTGNDDYLIRILAFVILFWCSAYDVPTTRAEKERLLGYLRAIRNSLQRYRSKKAGKRYWDTELDKKNYGKAVLMILSVVLNPNKDCVDHLAELPEKDMRDISYFAAEATKCKRLQTYSSQARQNCCQLEDSPILQGSLLPFLGETDAVLSYTEFAALFADDQFVPLSKALLACGEDDCYFGIPSGESGNNRHRVAFCDNDPDAWSVSLLYARDDFSKNNVSVLKILLDRLRNGETLETIADTYCKDCEQTQRYTWRYYFIKYNNAVFGTNGTVKISQRDVPAWPTFDLHYNNTDWYACRTSYVMSRFSEDNTCNVFLIMAAHILCQQYPASFNGGQDAVLTCGDHTVKATYDWARKCFVLSDAQTTREVEPHDHTNIVLELVSAMETMLNS